MPAASKLSSKIPAILLEGDEPVAPAAASPSPRLPQNYGTGRLFLTARDPHWLHAQWDLAPEVQHRSNALSEDHHLVVRLHPASPLAGATTEAHVHPESHYWFVHAHQAGALYIAELGYYAPGRNWVSLARSGAAATPPDRADEDKTVRMATVFSGPLPTAPAPSALPGPSVSRARFMRAAPAFRQLLLPEFPLVLWSEEQPEAETALPVGVPQVPGRNGFSRPLRMFPQDPEPDFPIASIEWTPEHERALAEILAWSEAQPVTIDSATLAEMVRKQLEQGGPASLAVGAGAAVSSPLGEMPRAQGEFWFNINAEVIVYGATRPDAKVFLDGEPVPLRPDGSFSLRFALPDGHFTLPMTAESAQGERRQARLELDRRTQYEGQVGAHPQDPALQPPAPPRHAQGS